MTDFLNLETFYERVSRRPFESLDKGPGHVGLFSLDELIFHNSQPMTYSRRDYYKISLVTGRSEIHYARKTISVINSALVFTNPLAPYHWERLDDQQTGFVCLFTEAFLGRSVSASEYPVFQHPDSSVIALDEDQRVGFSELFLSIQQELASDYAYKYDVVRNQILNVIHQAQKLQPIPATVYTGHNAAERIQRLFTELLERQFPIDSPNQRFGLRAASEIANRLQVHVNHLNRVLRETTGQTTSQYVSNRILEEARRLLKETDWTINEISWSLGFDEPHHFSTFFKKRTQHTPTQFRQLSVV